MLSQCASDDIAIEERRKTILRAQEMQLRYLDGLNSDGYPPPPPIAQPISQTKHRATVEPARVETSSTVDVLSVQDTTDAVVQRRARVGPQRYLILTSLRAAGPLTLGEITTLNRTPRAPH